MAKHHPFSLRSAECLLMAILVVGCSEEMHVFCPNDGNRGGRLELHATIEQNSRTRADESGFADGDRFGLFVVNYSGDQPGTLTLSDNQVNNVAVAYNADANTWQAATDIYWRDNVTPADIYGYYPFHNGMSDVRAYDFEVSSDQSIPSRDGYMANYEASDLLWAKTAHAVPGEKVELRFSHIMAGVKVVLQQGDGFEDGAWDRLSKIVTVDNTIRTSEVDLSTGTVTPTGDFDRNIVMNAEDDAWRAVVVPQTVASGKAVIGITIDGKPYAYNRTDGMKYTAGKLHTFTIKIDRKGDGGDYTLTLVNEDISPWEADKSSHDFVENAYITVHCPEPGKLRDVLNEKKIDFNTVRNLKISGILTTEDFDLMRNELLSLTAINLKEVKIKNVRYWLYDEDTGITEEVEEDDILPSEALRGKSTLRRVILPDGLKKIGSSALYDLALNSTVTIPESVTHLLEGAFSGIREGATIVMPHHLEYIGGDAFYECKADIELFFANSIKYIGSDAFWGASNVHGTLTIPNKIEHIGEGAFHWGSSGGDNRVDGEIVIPPTITEISDWAFCGINIKGGTKVVLHDGITKIGGNAFGGISFASGFMLPKKLKEIGAGAFEECHFVDELILPESVHVIGVNAFSRANLKGTLKIPAGVEILSPTSLTDCGWSVGSFGGTELENVVIGDNVEIIGGRAFIRNNFLRSVEIGKNVERIGMEAFADCPGLQRVVCLAKEPPKLYDNVFVGFDPLHCHLEVPEESVELYKAATGWRDFQFISPHRELSVGIHEQTCLNKGLSRSVIIYSEGEWRVKSAPSWIHVSPDHADYKEEITFTVDPLVSGAGKREGKVVFELVGKDYTAECDFTQYDYSYNEDTPIVLQKASAKSKPVNLFIVGDGFGAEEIVNGNYLDRMNETMEQFFALEPYKTYRSHFNVSTSVAMSLDNKVATLQNRRLDRLNTFGVDLDVPVVMDYAKECSGFITSANVKDAIIVVVSNMDAFTGKSTIDDSGCALSCVSLSSDVYPYDQRALVQHYAGGQAFAGLAVEYVTHNENIKSCTCPFCNGLSTFYDMKSKGMFENVSLLGKMNDAPWSQFIFHPKYNSMVDMLEGGYYHFGVWRSEPQSVMGTYISYYNTISRYAIYKAIMRRAGLSQSLEDFIANDKIEQP
ncbi:MAG: fimbrillin family protein [Prevotella sp.]|nr:fimbrillin family protein [Prevotella sp.]